MSERHVIDARTFKPKGRPKPSGCRQCGAPPPPNVHEGKRHCSTACARKAYKLRKEGAILEYVSGVCPVCGASFTPYQTYAFCSPRCRRRWQQRTRAFEAFRSKVEWPLPLSWLAKKLSKKGEISPDDPRLGQVALALAERGELVVYIGKDGRVGMVGKPKQRRRAS